MKSNAYTGFASIQVRTNAKAWDVRLSCVRFLSKQHNNVAVGLRQCCLLDAKNDAKKAYSAYKNCLKHALGIQLPVSGIKSNMLKVSDPEITEIFQYFG